MTTWTAPFGPASLRIDAEREIAKVSAEPFRLPCPLKAAGCRRRAVRGNRLEHGGSRLCRGARQGPGLRAAHAGTRVIA